MNVHRCAMACIGAALLALAGGCELVGDLRDLLPEETAAAPAPPAETKAAPPPPPPPPPKPDPEVARASPPAAGTESRRERPAPAPEPAPTPDLDPRRLVGIDKDEALAILGSPSAVREETPSHVWSYKSRECTLDLFFYMDVSTRAFRVVTWELATSPETADARRACLARLKAASGAS